MHSFSSPYWGYGQVAQEPVRRVVPDSRAVRHKPQVEMLLADPITKDDLATAVGAHSQIVEASMLLLGRRLMQALPKYDDEEPVFTTWESLPLKSKAAWWLGKSQWRVATRENI